MEKRGHIEKDKSYYILLSVCIVIWTAVVALLGIGIILFVDIKRINVEPNNFVVVEEVNVEINNSVVVVEGDTTVVPEIAKKYNQKTEDNIKRKNKQIAEYSSRVLEAVTVWSKDFTLEEAVRLTKKIEKAALNNHLKIEEAFCIVHIESDFRPNAFNGEAYGLCQITRPCLEEYNKYNNHSTKYSLEEDMFDVDKNLEVGFWYYNRLIHHYGSASGLTTTNEMSLLRDAYIAYNFGITAFSSIGRWGRNELRKGRYPCDVYGYKAGSRYQPYFRFKEKAIIWINQTN